MYQSGLVKLFPDRKDPFDSVVRSFGDHAVESLLDVEGSNIFYVQSLRKRLDEFVVIQSVDFVRSDGVGYRPWLS